MKRRLAIVSILVLLCSQVVILGNIATAQEDTEEDEWDFTGWFRLNSDAVRIPIHTHERLDDSIPIISSASDVIYENETTGNAISWTARDFYPFNYPDDYIIFLDGEEYDDGNWNTNETIKIYIDELGVGIHNLNITVQDRNGNKATDEVQISVFTEAAPHINNNVDLTYVEGRTGNILSWTATDLNLANYTVYKDGSFQDSDDWGSERWNETVPIRYSVDGYSLGEYNITVVVTDIFGHSSKDEVIVRVVEEDTFPYNEYQGNSLDMGIIGLDTDDNEEMDKYFGFYGISIYDVEDYHKDFFVPNIRVEWKFKIPETSSLRWKIMYYPDEVYSIVEGPITLDAPIYYVNLTEDVGVNLLYEINFGQNSTFGNFTTYSPSNPLFPEYRHFPGFTFALPLFMESRENLVTETGFFSSSVSYLTLISFSFLTLYLSRKRRKKQLENSV